MFPSKTKTPPKSPSPRFEIIYEQGSIMNGNYVYIMLDTKSGVKYLTNMRGITPLLDAEGNVAK